MTIYRHENLTKKNMPCTEDPISEFRPIFTLAPCAPGFLSAISSFFLPTVRAFQIHELHPLSPRQETSVSPPNPNPSIRTVIKSTHATQENKNPRLPKPLYFVLPFSSKPNPTTPPKATTNVKTSPLIFPPRGFGISPFLFSSVQALASISPPHP